jgi:hypothetical protein
MGLAIAGDGAFGLLDCRHRHLPPRRIVGLMAGLVAPRTFATAVARAARCL